MFGLMFFFQIWSALCRSKINLGSFFVFLTKNWSTNFYHSAQNPKLSLRPFWPQDLGWPWSKMCFVCRKIRIVIRTVRYTIHLYVMILLPFDTVIMRDKAKHDKSINIFLWPDLRRHRWTYVDSNGLTWYIFQVYRRSLEFCQSAGLSRNLVAAKIALPFIVVLYLETTQSDAA